MTDFRAVHLVRPRRNWLAGWLAGWRTSTKISISWCVCMFVLRLCLRVRIIPSIVNGFSRLARCDATQFAQRTTRQPRDAGFVGHTPTGETDERLSEKVSVRRLCGTIRRNLLFEIGLSLLGRNMNIFITIGRV